MKIGNKLYYDFSLSSWLTIKLFILYYSTHFHYDHCIIYMNETGNETFNLSANNWNYLY